MVWTVAQQCRSINHVTSHACMLFFTCSTTYIQSDNKGTEVAVPHVSYSAFSVMHNHLSSSAILVLPRNSTIPPFKQVLAPTDGSLQRYGIIVSCSNVTTIIDPDQSLHCMHDLQVLKGEKVSLSCDVFSYGMVLIELFKREVPFAGINDLKVAGMISEGEVGCCVIIVYYSVSNMYSKHCQ